MALSTDQQVDILFKKLFGKADSDTDKQFFEEPNTFTAVPATSVWGAPPDKTDPTLSPISAQLVTDAAFTHIAGTDAGYVLSGNTNIIPFNYGTIGTNGESQAPTGYNYVLKTAGGTPIPFGQNDWVLDPESGILNFHGGNPIGVSSANPPTLTCYKYIGPTGATGAIILVFNFTILDVHGGKLVWIHNLNQVGLTPSITDNTGERLEPTSVLDVDANTMTIDLAGYTIGGTWTAVLLG